jgi:hypothetical protein
MTYLTGAGSTEITQEHLGGHPLAVAVNRHNSEVWVADADPTALKRFTESGEPSGETKGPEYPGSECSAPVLESVGIAVDNNGDLWVADREGSRIFEFSPNGVCKLQLGAQGSGQYNFSHPTGIAVGPNGDIWVLDAGNHRVKKFSSTGVFLSEFWIGGQDPWGIAVGLQEEVWVSSFEGREALTEYRASGSFIQAIESPHAGSGFNEYDTGLTINPAGDVFVAFFTGARVEAFGPGIEEDLGEFFATGLGEGQFFYPFGIAVDTHGDVWVTAGLTYRVEKWVPVAAVDKTAPTVSGTAKELETLHATHGTWEGTPPITYEYNWQRLEGGTWIPIEGAAHAPEYTLQAADVGKQVRVEVVASDPAGKAYASSAATGTVAAAPPVITSAPAVPAGAAIGQSLSASEGAWVGTPTVEAEYSWERCNGAATECEVIQGATSRTYTPSTTDTGHTLRLSVVAKNRVGQAQATSPPTAIVVEAPKVYSIAPRSGPSEGGTAVTITGSGFESDDSVEFGSTELAAQVLSSTQLQVTTPPGSTSGAGYVNVQVNDGPVASLPGAADQFSYDAPPSRAWLGLDGNSTGDGGPIGEFTEHEIVYDRGNGIEWCAGEHVEEGGGVSPIATALDKSLSAGMTPLVIIEYHGYEGAGGRCRQGSEPGNSYLPTDAEAERYAQQFVAAATEIDAKAAELFPRSEHAHAEVLFEPINEPWYRGTEANEKAAESPEEAQQYAHIVADILRDAKTTDAAAHSEVVPLSHIYVGAHGHSWVSAMYQAVPELETEIQGWYVHPYGFSNHVTNNESGGILSVPNARKEMASGENNVIVSEIGYCSREVYNWTLTDGATPGGETCCGEANTELCERLSGSPTAWEAAAAYPAETLRGPYYSAKAGEELTQALRTAAEYHAQGWLKALLVYDRGIDGGFGVEYPTSKPGASKVTSAGELTAQGKALVGFSEEVRVQTQSATGVSAVAATLHGSIEPPPSATAYEFQYGVQQVTEHTTGETPVARGEGDPQESATLSGLQPSSTYQFRIVARSGSKVADGTTQDFTTGPSVASTAYETSQGNLAAYFGPTDTAVASGLLEAPTSPAITAIEGTEYEAAISKSSLWTYSSGRSALGTEIGLTVMPGTSPSIARLQGASYEVALQTSGGDLATYSPQHGASVTADALAPASSPSIAAIESSWVAAVVGATGTLELISSSGAVHSTQYPVAPDSSPSIVALAGGAYEVAFQSSNASLWTYSSTTGAAVRQTAGLMPSTSPSIAWLGGEGWELAYQSVSGALWTMNSLARPVNTGTELMPATSPAMASAGSGWAVAFQGPEGHLHTASATGAPTATNVAVMPNSSPSIAPVAGGGYLVAYVAPSGDLSTYSTTTRQATSTGYVVQAASSPSSARNVEGPPNNTVVADQAANGILQERSAVPDETSGFGRWRDLGEHGEGVAPGSSPDTIRVVPSPSGLEYPANLIGYQATTGGFAFAGYLAGLDVGPDQPFSSSVMPATTPGYAATIVEPTEVRLEVAYQGTNGDLYTWNSDGNPTAGTDTGRQMAPDSSPSVAALPSSSFEIAFVGSNGHLWTYSTASQAFAERPIAVLPGTSPSIVPVEQSYYDVAVQAAGPASTYGKLLVWDSADGSSVVSKHLMMPGTNPSIMGLGGSSYTVAYQGASGELWRTSHVAGLPEVSEDLGNTVMPGTSPAAG